MPKEMPKEINWVHVSKLGRTMYMYILKQYGICTYELTFITDLCIFSFFLVHQSQMTYIHVRKINHDLWNIDIIHVTNFFLSETDWECRRGVWLWDRREVEFGTLGSVWQVYNPQGPSVLVSLRGESHTHCHGCYCILAHESDHERESKNIM